MQEWSALGAQITEIALALNESERAALESLRKQVSGFHTLTNNTFSILIRLPVIQPH
jgi:hypothetical protein